MVHTSTTINIFAKSAQKLLSSTSMFINAFIPFKKIHITQVWIMKIYFMEVYLKTNWKTNISKELKTIQILKIVRKKLPSMMELAVYNVPLVILSLTWNWIYVESVLRAQSMTQKEKNAFQQKVQRLSQIQIQQKCMQTSFDWVSN